MYFFCQINFCFAISLTLENITSIIRSYYFFFIIHMPVYYFLYYSGSDYFITPDRTLYSLPAGKIFSGKKFPCHYSKKVTSYQIVSCFFSVFRYNVKCQPVKITAYKACIIPVIFYIPLKYSMICIQNTFSFFADHFPS